MENFNVLLGKPIRFTFIREFFENYGSLVLGYDLLDRLIKIEKNDDLNQIYLLQQKIIKKELEGRYLKAYPAFIDRSKQTPKLEKSLNA